MREFVRGKRELDTSLSRTIELPKNVSVQFALVIVSWQSIETLI